MSRPAMRTLICLAVLAGLAFACGGDGAGGEDSQAVRLAREISATYSDLLQEADVLLESRPATDELRESLSRLRDEYRVTFAEYACLVESLDAAGRDEVARSVPRNQAPDAGLAGRLDAAADGHEGEPAIGELIAEIRTLDDYAFVDRLATSRPGEMVLCGGA